MTWHLIYAVPLTFTIGFLVGVFFAGAVRDAEGR